MLEDDKKNKYFDDYMNTLTEEQRLKLTASLIKEEEEEAKRKEKYEKKSKIVSVICFVLGLLGGIKYYFMDPEDGFIIDLISTAFAIGIFEVIGQAILRVCMDPEDL